MPTLIYVFSGTGNTLTVGKEIASYLGNAKVIEIKDLAPIEDLDSYDLVGFGYPIHAFRAPEIFIDFLKRLPKVRKKRCFIFKSSGEGLHLNDASSIKAMRVLRKKGFQVVSEASYLMPYNIIFRFSDSLAKEMYVYSLAQSFLLADHLEKQASNKMPLRLYARMVPPLFRIEWWFAKANGKYYKVALNRCVRCLRCVKACPTQNIVYDGESFKFKNKCVLCLKCAFNCPTDAISIGLLNNWKVNGDYHLESLAADPAIPFLSTQPKGIIEKTANRYFKKIDSSLKAKGLTISSFRKDVTTTSKV